MYSKSYLILWSGVLAMGNFDFGYASNVINILWDFTPGIFEFEPERRRWINAVANVAFPLGACIGGGISWVLVRYGKRKALIFQAALSIVGASFQMVKSYESFIVGRGIMGLSFGISNAISPMFIVEIAPEKMRGMLISFVALWINIGLIVPISFNFLLPVFIRPFSDVPGYGDPLKNYHVIWREIFAAPIVVASIKLLLLLFIFRKENPIYEEYLNAKSDSYETSGDSVGTESEFGGEISINIQQSAEKTPTRMEKDSWKALCKVRGKRKLISGIIVRSVLQLSGIDIVLNFSYTLRLDPDSTHWNLRLFITLLSLILTPISMFILTYYKRKNLFLYGSLLSCFGLTVLFQASMQVNYTDYGVGMFHGFSNVLLTVFVTIFAINFWVTTASTIYVYGGEVLTDKGMSIATAVHWFLNAWVEFLPVTAFRISELIGTQIRFHDANSIFFFIFGGISMMSFFLITIFIKESLGKSRGQISEAFGQNNYHSLTSTVSGGSSVSSTTL